MFRKLVGAGNGPGSNFPNDLTGKLFGAPPLPGFHAPRGAWKPGSGGAPKSLPVKSFGKFDPGPFPAPTSLRNTQYVQ